MTEIEFKIQEAEDLIASELARNGAPCVTSSFQTECVALVHMLVRQRPEIPVLFLETGYHFAETIEYRDRISKDWKLNLVNLEAKQSVAHQEAQFGILNRTEPNRCCALRKVAPLFEGLANYDTWFTALRREQSPTRANLQPVEAFKLPTGKTLQKISPLAGWTNRDVWAYLSRYNIPALPLYDQGYTSIGCQPCTALPLDPNNPRSGRWQGQEKLECGIHIQAK
ncbi:MAG TPA: phosphoadenylyl-sulfate reductase [Bryobacteraceae bacterium]|nr:phosphoadenylyl-sulfate reductase [Bryobacteraceae bacterium]